MSLRFANSSLKLSFRKSPIYNVTRHTDTILDYSLGDKEATLLQHSTLAHIGGITMYLVLALPSSINLVRTSAMWVCITHVVFLFFLVMLVVHRWFVKHAKANPNRPLFRPHRWPSDCNASLMLNPSRTAG
jgi:hypothetical protein